MSSESNGPRFTAGVPPYPAPSHQLSTDQRSGGDLVTTVIGLMVLATLTLGGALLSQLVVDQGIEGAGLAVALTQVVPIGVLIVAVAASITLRWCRRDAFWVPIVGLLITILSFGIGAGL